MALTVETNRIFKCGDIELPDPDPKMSVKEVIKFYSAQYPEIASSAIPTPKAKGDTFVYEFENKVEGKG